MSTIPPPLNVSSVVGSSVPVSSPLPSPTFSLAPQTRASSMRAAMQGTTTPNQATQQQQGIQSTAATTASSNNYGAPPGFGNATPSTTSSTGASSGSSGGYSLRGGRIGAATRAEYEERSANSRDRSDRFGGDRRGGFDRPGSSASRGSFRGGRTGSGRDEREPNDYEHDHKSGPSSPSIQPSASGKDHHFSQLDDSSHHNDRHDRYDRSTRDRGGSGFERGGSGARDYKSSSYRGGRGGSSTGGGPSGDRHGHSSDRSEFHSSRSDRDRERDHDAEEERRNAQSQAIIDSYPVVGLLETPPSPTLPPSLLNTLNAATEPNSKTNSTAEVGNIFAVLSDGAATSPTALDFDDDDVDTFPLDSPWTFYFDKKPLAGKGKSAAVPPKLQGGQADPLTSYESNLQTLARIDSVQSFWSIQNHLLLPSQMEQNSTLHFFKEGIKPVWEDENNRGGGKWIFRLPPKDKYLLDHYWQNILLACIGGTLDDSPHGDEICGVVLSKRKMGDRIAVWNRNRDVTGTVIALGHRIKAALQIGLTSDHHPTIALTYEDNEVTAKMGYCAFGTNVKYVM